LLFTEGPLSSLGFKYVQTWLMAIFCFNYKTATATSFCCFSFRYVCF